MCSEKERCECQSHCMYMYVNSSQIPEGKAETDYNLYLHISIVISGDCAFKEQSTGRDTVTETGFADPTEMLPRSRGRLSTLSRDFGKTPSLGFLSGKNPISPHRQDHAKVASLNITKPNFHAFPIH